MDEYSSDLHEFIIKVGLRHVQCLVTLTLFQAHGLLYRISFEQVDRFCQTCIDISFEHF